MVRGAGRSTMNSNVEAAIKLGQKLGVGVSAWGGDMVLVGSTPMSAHRALTVGIQWAAQEQ